MSAAADSQLGVPQLTVPSPLWQTCCATCVTVLAHAAAPKLVACHRLAVPRHLHLPTMLPPTPPHATTLFFSLLQRWCESACTTSVGR